MVKEVLSTYFGRIARPVDYMRESKALKANAAEEQSIPMLQEGVKNFPNDHVLWFTLGKSLFFLNRLQESEKAIKRSLDLNPYDQRTRTFYNRILTKTGQQHHRR